MAVKPRFWTPFGFMRPGFPVAEMARGATDTTIRPGRLPAASQAFLVDQLKPPKVGPLLTTWTKSFARFVGRTFLQKFFLQAAAFRQFRLAPLDLVPGRLRVRNRKKGSPPFEGLPLQSRSPLKRLLSFQSNNPSDGSAFFFEYAWTFVQQASRSLISKVRVTPQAVATSAGLTGGVNFPALVNRSPTCFTGSGFVGGSFATAAGFAAACC